MTRYIPTAARMLLGLIFFVFGLNGFLGFLPQPPMTPEAGAFAGALAATGYMFPLIKSIEVLVGIALLSNRFVPLALTVLAPITVNIFAFHAFLSPGLALPVVIVALQLFLAYAYRAHYRGVLQAHAKPALPSLRGPRSAQAAHA
jgi:hypothetical protein